MATRQRGSVTWNWHDDRTQLERIYDRLRKASWRRTKNPWTVNIFDLGGRHLRHRAYIAGVRDALNAVRREGGG